jgi:hypothetical protein
MRKLFLIPLLLFVINSFGQNKKFFPFISPSIMIPTTTGYSASIGVEAGIWGNTSRWSFSGFYSQTPATKEKFTGGKIYYTIFDLNFLSSMAYLAPQMKINQGSMFIIEEGVGLNLTLSKQVLLGVYYFQQQYKGVRNSPGISMCVVYLFK